MISNGTKIEILNDKMYINDVEVKKPFGMKGNIVSQINGKLYVDGYAYNDGKWKRTLLAIWHYIF
jgi:hypothetical protein